MDPEEHSASNLTFPLGTLPRTARVYEVGPRDGLQNELRSVPTKDKLRLLDALVAAGETHIEATSFVSPKWIPQLADADDVVRALGHRPGLSFSALVPNLKGLERARAAGLEEAAVFLSASESHSRKNINQSIAEALDSAQEVAAAAESLKMRVRAYVSVVWGCPFEGDVPVERVVQLCQRLRDMGCYQISLGDTIGVGTPGQTAAICQATLAVLEPEQLALHLHDTRGTALANALVGLAQGVTTLDASIGGLGGCPYAPGAAGNLATEDLVYMLHGMGIQTGIDLTKLVQASEIAQEVVGRKLPSKYLQAVLGERERASRKSAAAR